MRRFFQLFLVLIISVSILTLSVITVSADYDTTNTGTVELSDVYANYSGMIVEVSQTVTNQNYQLWILPDYSNLTITFQANFQDNVSNFRLEIPIDYSYLTSYSITSCQLHAGGDLTPIQCTIEGNNLVLSGTNEANTDYFICDIIFDIKANSAEPGYIYFGRFATANYDVSFDEDFNELNSEVDGMTSQLENLESEALGGKTDEEIQSEAADAADFDYDSLNSEATAGVTGFINDCLDAFGVGYSSLLLFSCSIGLCIFVIGRRGGS